MGTAGSTPILSGAEDPTPQRIPPDGSATSAGRRAAEPRRHVPRQSLGTRDALQHLRDFYAEEIVDGHRCLP
jgi:hypothetical protein